VIAELEKRMFFMGGMTMGYLHPPAKSAEQNRADLADDKARRPVGPHDAPADNAMDRALIWARRILC
jgi:hypothetical protein